MIQDKILYTDGHDVTVTDTMLMVRNMSYHLVGITKHGLHIVKPHRLPGYLLFVLGLTLLVCGTLSLWPVNVVPAIAFMERAISGRAIVVASGAFLAVVGILIIGLLRERYAVRISTAEGEKNVVVSSHKEYVNQIVNALNRAFNFVRGTKLSDVV
ncbi:MAG TPA: DUF6232 family protein [Cyclobacteriaceae bacterium]|nr:DUF6232 family protein [Cyclobacteriaceae bacterium]